MQMLKFNSEEISVNYEQPCVLIGEASSFKTTILLHYAYIKVKEFKNIENGIIICSQTKLDKEDRLIFGRGDYKKQINAESTDRIKLKYIESYIDLCKYLQAIHLLESCPRFIFIDDINYYVSSDHKKLGFILFLLKNISTFICSRYGNTNNFNVLIAWQIDTMEVSIPLRDKPECTENDINSNKIKQVCLLFRNFTQNLFQIMVSPQKINLYKVYQDFSTLKMHKSVFRNKEFKEILDHIKELL